MDDFNRPGEIGKLEKSLIGKLFSFNTWFYWLLTAPVYLTTTILYDKSRWAGIYGQYQYSKWAPNDGVFNVMELLSHYIVGFVAGQVKAKGGGWTSDILLVIHLIFLLLWFLATFRWRDFSLAVTAAWFEIFSLLIWMYYIWRISPALVIPLFLYLVWLFYLLFVTHEFAKLNS
jgi:tryptophan-rich sensory protein